MRKIIGITGKSGACKSSVGKILSEKYENGIHVDADKIGYSALKQSEIAQILVEKFGNQILNDSDNIDRKQLGNLVFSDKKSLQFLEQIIWEFIQKEIDKILNSSTDTVVIECIKFPLIELWDKCDIKILIYVADDEQRKIKIMERDNISEEDFLKRDDASMDYSLYKFDYVIKHNYVEDELETKVDNIYKELVKK